MATLSLGIVDANAMPADRDQFLNRYHMNLPFPEARSQFRDEGNGVWRGFTATNSGDVRALQQFLHDKGFMPKDDMVDGIFGYSTQAAVRLFQEYVRTIEKNPSIGAPDGSVGPNTQSHIQRWINNGLTCEWAQWNTSNPMAEYADWMNLIAKAKQHFSANGSPMLDLVRNHANRGDTRYIDQWDDSHESVHLIGLRQGEENAVTTVDNKGRFVRANDDLFIFLIRGMVFKFWGSTDPNPAVVENPAGNPFLIEGQHTYRFGWHGTSLKKKDQVYRALEPATSGVLVYRVPNAKGLTPEEVAGGLDRSPVEDINIHWSGMGGYNFSAGCQVIAGKSYINHRDEVVQMGQYAATSYSELGGSKGRGAYNMFTDLLLSYGPSGVRTITYTLGRDETLRLSDKWPPSYVRDTVKRMM